MQPQPAIPREFIQQFEAAHLHRLRQRVFWYCVAVLALLVLAFTRIGLDLAMPPDIRESLGYIILRIVSAATLVACYVCVTLYILPAHRGREQIIKAYSLLIITTTLVVTLSMPRIDNGRFVPGALPEQFGAAAVAQQGVTLFFILLLHLIASLLVELSPRDGLRIYVPMLVIYGIGLVLDQYLSISGKVRLALIAPALGLPGLLWSLWRHRAFADQFVARATAERYGKVSKDLADARRVHEAMLPPPLTRGRVQVRYRYEPMLDIGGDFLYIHPLSAPRGPADSPISMVLIDVTGHGFPAALAVNRLYVELTRAFASSDDPSPAHIITELNRSMSSGLMPEAIFATAIAIRGQVMAGKRVLEWCGAGHPDAILHRTDGTLVRLRSSVPMLGVLDPDLFNPECQSIEVSTGDQVIAYTDGVLEATNEEGEQFGVERIEAALLARQLGGGAETAAESSLAGDSAGAIAADVAAATGVGPTDHRLVDILFAAVETFRSGPTLDDVLIVEMLAAE